MFSGSLFVVLLVVFVSQALGQNNTTVSPNATSSVLSQSSTVTIMNSPPITIVPTTPTTIPLMGQSSTAVSSSAAMPPVPPQSSITATLSVHPTTMSIIGTSEKPTSSSERTLGQNNTTVSPNATTSVLSPSSTVTIMNSPPITIVPTTPTTTPLMAVAPNATSSVALQSTTVPGGNGPTSSITATTTPPLAKTCAMLGVTIDLAWDEDYGNESSETYKNVSKEYSSALVTLYSTKHKDVKVLQVTFQIKTGKVFAEAKLCLVFMEEKNSPTIKAIFTTKVATGVLSVNLQVIKDSAVVLVLEVEYKNYKAQEGECDKCDGAGGPFIIVAVCVPKTGFSCNGLEKTKTKETEDCTTHCSSTAVTVSSLILAIGILLSFSFQ